MKSETLTMNSAAFITVLQERFEKNVSRHPDLNWIDVENRIRKSPDKMASLYEMEITGGEPDVVQMDAETGEIIFFDCSQETPFRRRSLCYDKAALDARKKHKPEGDAQSMAKKIGVNLLNEDQYRFLQSLGNFDLKTSSWIETPHEVRKMGGAIFGDKRYGRCFIYHNGADSYYAARGFRGWLGI